MIGMKRNKAAMIKRRQSLLAVMAVVLILASIGTGYLGFVYDPGEDVPGGSPLPTGVNPVSATARNDRRHGNNCAYHC